MIITTSLLRYSAYVDAASQGASVMKSIVCCLMVLAWASASAAECPDYVPQLPPELARDVAPVLNLGISGDPLARLPGGVTVAPPPAQDAITYPPQPPGIARIKAGNSRDYQIQDTEHGRPSSPFKTRAEFSTQHVPATFYGEGDVRIYRVAVCLHDGWPWDASAAIFTQFKRVGGGPDLFLAVKHRNVVLRVGRPGEPDAKQTTLVADVATGKWLEIVLRTHWSTTEDGGVETFYRYGDEREYRRAKDEHGRNLQAPTRRSYIKFGIYKPGNFPAQTPPDAAQVLDIGNVAVFVPGHYAHAADSPPERRPRPSHRRHP